MPKQKKTRRSQTKYAALDPQLNLKTRYDSIDFDYVKDLPEEWVDPITGKKYNPKQYLNDFVNEYVHTDFDSGKKRIQKKKRVESERNKFLRELQNKIFDNFKLITDMITNSNINHSSKIRVKKLINKFKTQIKKQIKSEYSFIEDIYKKEAYDRNNNRNRCVLTRARAQGLSTGFDELPENIMVKDNVEDEIIDALDLHFAEKLKKSQNGSNNGSENGE